MSTKHEACIANVYDPKSATYQLQLVMDMAWNRKSVSASTLTKHLQSWLSSQLGSNLGRHLLPIMKEYYRLTSIRQPEYMIMPFGNMEFHSGEFGNELERYLYAYDQLKAKVTGIERSVPNELSDTYFQLVKYPVFSAALIAERSWRHRKHAILPARDCSTRTMKPRRQQPSALTPISSSRLWCSTTAA